MKPTFKMLVGLPGSGKSTYCKDCENVFSSDAIREELSGDASNQNINDKVFNLLHTRVKDCLMSGNSCVYDATNISWKRRKAFLSSLNNIDCNKVCVVIATPFEVCCQQNLSRERKVPYKVIERMYKNFDIPFYNEGWDDIILFYPKESYKSAYGHWGDFIHQSIDYSQHNSHHTASLGMHCLLCRVGIDSDCKELIIASAIHDCGKPFTKTFLNKKGIEDGDAHYYNHDKVGCYNSLFYEKEDGADSLVVSAYIRWHMLMYFYKNWEQKTIDKYIKEFTSCDKLSNIDFYSNLEKLHNADLSAH